MASSIASLFDLLFCIGVTVFIAKLFAKASQKLPPKTYIPVPKPESKQPDKIFPFKKKKYLMTQMEHKFFDVLEQIFKDKLIVIPQVALSRIIEVHDAPESYGSDSAFSNFNRINKKSVDFVIFDKQYFTPLLVIELDDYTHNYYNRRQRDEFLDEALKAANLKIIHIKPQNVYNISEITSIIKSSLQL